MKSVNSFSPTNSNNISNCNLINENAANTILRYTQSLFNMNTNKNNLTNDEIGYLTKRKYVAQWQPKQIIPSNNHHQSQTNDYAQNANNINSHECEENFIKRKKIKISRTSSPLSTSSSSSSSSLSHSSSNINLKNVTTCEEQQSPLFRHNHQYPTINIKTVSHFNVTLNNNNKNGSNKNHDQQLFIKLKSNYMTNFFSNLRDYMIENMPFDVCLIVNNHHKINAHKLMLSNASNYLRQKISELKSDCNIKNDNDTDVLELKQINNFECLEMCIRFIYTGGSQLNLTNLDLIDDLKMTAKLLELNDLVGVCDLINANIETKNIVLANKTLTNSPNLDNSLSLSSTNNISPSFNSSNASSFKKYESLTNLNILNRNNSYSSSATGSIDDQTSSNSLINSKIIQLLLNSSQQHQNHTNIWQQQHQYSSDFLMSSPQHILNSFLQMTQNNANQFNSSKGNKSVEINNCNNNSYDNEQISNHDDNDDDRKSIINNNINNCNSPLNNSNDENKFKRMLKTKLERYQRINNEGHDLFDLLDVSKNVRDYLLELLATTLNFKNKNLISDLDMEIDILSRDLIIKDKYIYPIMFSNILSDTKKNDIEKQILINNQLNECFENYTYINLFNNCSNFLNSLNLLKQGGGDFYKQSLIIFSLSIGDNNHFKFNNFIIQEKLNFTDLNVLKDDIRKCLDTFLNDYVMKKLNLKNGSNNDSISSSSFLTQVNNVFYLKKPSNCKTIKLEEIKTSTDCFRALVEYSRVNALNEKPYVLVTIKANIVLSINQK